jgi:hypothetical protein
VVTRSFGRAAELSFILAHASQRLLRAVICFAVVWSGVARRRTCLTMVRHMLDLVLAMHHVVEGESLGKKHRRLFKYAVSTYHPLT